MDSTSYHEDSTAGKRALDETRDGVEGPKPKRRFVPVTSDFRVRWDKSEELFHGIWQLLEEYQLKLQIFIVNNANFLESKAELHNFIENSTDYLEAKALAEEILNLTKQFYQERRYLYSKSVYQKNLKPYQIFLSYAEERKKNYAGWFPELFRPSNAKVYFDEHSPQPNDMPSDHMIFAAINCPVAIVVVSPQFFTTNPFLNSLFLQLEWITSSL